MDKMSNIKWLPLESNPDAMNKCLKKLGVPEKWGISSSLEEEYVNLIPTPCLAVLLLFPVVKEEDKSATENGKHKNEKEEIKGVYHMKETFEHACGAVALIHAIANNEERLDLEPDSILKQFFHATRNLSPEERGKQLEENVEIAKVFGAQEGQTEDSNADDGSRHFITFVKVEDKLVELDGRKSGPVVHASTADENFIQDAFRVCKSFMASWQNPSSFQFTVLSFGALEGM